MFSSDDICGINTAANLVSCKASDLIHLGANEKLPFYTFVSDISLKKYDFSRFPKNKTPFFNTFINGLHFVRLLAETLAEIEARGSAVCTVVDVIDLLSGQACTYEVAIGGRVHSFEVKDDNKLYILRSELIAAVYPQLVEENRKVGRYNLQEASELLQKEAGERSEHILQKLKSAAQDGVLPVYELGKRARYEYGPNMAEPVNEFYKEVYWDDLNNWLDEKEPRILFRFKKPEISSVEPLSHADTMPIVQQPLPAKGLIKEQFLCAAARSDGVSLVSHTPTDESGLSRREKQIQSIVSAAATLGYEVLSIPNGGKGKLMAECKRVAPELFGAGKDPFFDAWKKAVKTGRIRTKDHDKFSRR